MSEVKPGYVYFLHAVNSDDGSGMERYKIGLTTRYVEDRLKELNSGQSPFWLVEKWSIQVSDCEAAESALHNHFASRRLYIDTSNGHTGFKDDIDSSVRKSTEWFVFRDDELSAVEESYQNVQSQYPWRMLAPNLRTNNQRQKTPMQDDRQWHQTTRYFDNQRSSGGGWGVAATLAAALIAIAVAPKMGSFAESVNTPRSKNGFEAPSLSMPQLPSLKAPSVKMPAKNPIDGAIEWMIAPFTKKTLHAPNYSGANIRQSPNGKIVGFAPNGSKASVKGRSGKWCEVDAGKWIWCDYLQ